MFICATRQQPFNQAWLVFIVALSLGFGCAPEPPAALRVGINSWPGYEFIFLAQEKGYFRDEHLNVRLVEFSSLSDCRRAYERGQIDAMGTTVVEVLMTRDQSSRSPQIVRICDYSNGADVILAQSAITNGAGLRGARIGVELASLGVTTEIIGNKSKATLCVTRRRAPATASARSVWRRN